MSFAPPPQQQQQQQQPRPYYAGPGQPGQGQFAPAPNGHPQQQQPHHQQQQRPPGAPFNNVRPGAPAQGNPAVRPMQPGMRPPMQQPGTEIDFRVMLGPRA